MRALVCKNNITKEKRSSGSKMSSRLPGWSSKIKFLLFDSRRVVDRLVALPRIFEISSLMAQSTRLRTSGGGGCSGNSMCGPTATRHQERSNERFSSSWNARGTAMRWTTNSCGKRGSLVVSTGWRDRCLLLSFICSCTYNSRNFLDRSRRRRENAKWLRATLMHECNVTCRSSSHQRLISCVHNNIVLV